jgi:homoserine O-acetyltransferase
LRRLLRVLVLIPGTAVPSLAEPAPARDYRPLAHAGSVILRDFRFHDGTLLAELRIHFSAWGEPRKNAAGEVANAVLLLHGTLGAGVEWGGPFPGTDGPHPLLGPGGPFDASLHYVVAPDTIGSGKSSKPSDGLRMRFPRYDLEDIVTAERRLLESLGVKHLLAVAGWSMGGRQTWQWGVQYPGFMDALIPMLASPFPNAGRRALVDFLPEAIIRNDPAFEDGNYRVNPPSVRLAELVNNLLATGAGALEKEYPTRADAQRAVFVESPTASVDATDFIYQLRLNDGFDAWSRLDQVRAPVLVINASGDELVPTELGHARRALARLQSATYLEVTEAAEHGHGALDYSVGVWGPQMRHWLETVGRSRSAAGAAGEP